jgi:predicted heme/steroid binding protein
MTVRIEKPALNLRAKLAELKTVQGAKGKQLLASEDIAQALEALGLSEFQASTADLAWNSSSDTYTANTTPTTVTKIHQGMKRCLLRDDGTVNYYLDPTDSTKKLDGTSATLTGADGNVMVEIPRFYFRQVKNGNTTTWQISDVPLAGYQLHPAFFKNGEIVDFRYIGVYDACLNFSRSITAVADAGGGDITVTTSGDHPLYAGDSVTISGTTSYDGDYTVVSRASGTTFTVTAAFVATETGTASGFVSGKNLDDMTSNIDTATDELASISGEYPLVGVTRDECRDLAANVGTGFRVQDFWLTCAVQLLYLVEYGTFYSQNELGDGNTGISSYPASSDDQTDSPHSVAGKSNALGNASTDTTSGASSASRDTAYMSYRGIEHFYGNCWNWVDGFNIGIVVDRDAFVSNNDADFADNTSTNYTDLGITMASANGYVQNIADVPGTFLATDTTGASSSTYLTDQFFQSTGNRVAYFGGSASNGALAGAFCWVVSASSSLASRGVGARLAY